MSLQTDAVAALAAERRRIDHRRAAVDVSAAGPMARLAADAVLQKGRAAESIRCADHRRLHAACVTEQTARVDRVVQLHLNETVVARRHAPQMVLRVVVDRRLIEEAVDLEEKRTSSR